MSSLETQDSAKEITKLVEGPKARFQVSCFARIDELVAQGVYPSHFADERKEVARLIENGLTDPEAQGVAFAEIGMDAIKQFQEVVDETEVDVVAKVENAINRLDEIKASLLLRKVVPINIKVLLNSINTARENILAFSDDFQRQLESIRNLQAKMSILTADEELQAILDRVNDDSDRN